MVKKTIIFLSGQGKTTPHTEVLFGYLFSGIFMSLLTRVTHRFHYVIFFH